MIRRLFQEPLFVFVLIAGALFLVDSMMNQQADIVINLSLDDQKIIIAEEERARGRVLLDHELENVLTSHVEEELLLKEAYAMGLHDDTMIRSRLLNKMRYLLSAELSKPSEEELRQFHIDHPEQFLLPGTWTFEQLYFSEDTLMDKQILQRLNTEEYIYDNKWGANFARHWENKHHEEVAAQFGSFVARAVTESDLNVWVGPIMSPHGQHFIRVKNVKEGELAPYEQVAHHVKNGWRQDQIRKRVKEKTTQLRDKFPVLIEKEIRIETKSSVL